MKNAVEVEPLTRKSKTGAVYQRRPEVEVQIREALQLDRENLISRLKISDFRDRAFMKNEAVVFLIRYHRKIGDDDLVNSLVTILIERLTRPINKRIQLIRPNLIDECRDEAISNVFRPLIDLERNSADFAQVRFWVWFDNRVVDAIEKYSRTAKKDAVSDSITRESDEDQFDLPGEVSGFEIGELTATEQKLANETVLKTLCADDQQLYVMRYLWEWEIENQNDSIPTISRHFGVSSRTIRSRLKRIELKLAEWKAERGI
ncbi:MAG: hypothetical protein AB7J13_06455 [Pyrinomonadaceae bacterium]